MKITVSDFLTAVGVLSLISAVIILTATHAQPVVTSEDKVRFIHDSLETEWYKKQLESYPFDHSKISDSLKK